MNVQDIREMFSKEMLAQDLTDHQEESMLELTGVSFTADEPTIFGEVNEDYIKRELDWYMSMSTYVRDIPGKVPSIWSQIASEKGEVNSNYGRLFFHDENGAQFQNVVATLIKQPSSRQAVAVYTRPSIHVDSKRDGMWDFICTNAVQYLIRDDELEVIVQMRSNDAIFGYRNDYAWQRFAQHAVQKRLLQNGVTVHMGDITWQVGSLHIYPRHRELVRQYALTGDFLGKVS